MNILITGQNSFTGLHLCKQFLEKGWNVYSLTSGNKEKLNRSQKLLLKQIELQKNYHQIVCNYEAKDIELVKSLKKNINVFVIHGYNVLNYKSKDLDPLEIARDSTEWLKEFPDTLKNLGCKIIAFTGTYFENFDLNLQTPYSISKTISWKLINYYFKDFSLLNYLFPNPFGIGEGKKFTNYLLTNFVNNSSVLINTPNQIRDNVPVDFLIEDYIDMISEISLFPKNKILRKSPSYFVESNLEFVNRIARQITCNYENYSPLIDIGNPEITDSVSGKNQIRSNFINRENNFWSDYLSFYNF